MTKKSSRSHLREIGNLRNNPAKKNIDGKLSVAGLESSVKINDFNWLISASTYLAGASLNCPF